MTQCFVLGWVLILTSFVDESPPPSSAVPTSSAATEKNYYIAQVRGMREFALSTL